MGTGIVAEWARALVDGMDDYLPFWLKAHFVCTNNH